MNSCLKCDLYEPFIDDLSPNEVKNFHLKRVKENCAKWLCNNDTCPHYLPTWIKDEQN
jgi:hypothetical protein